MPNGLNSVEPLDTTRLFIENHTIIRLDNLAGYPVVTTTSILHISRPPACPALSNAILFFFLVPDLWNRQNIFSTIFLEAKLLYEPICPSLTRECNHFSRFAYNSTI